jgi:hypothetical protein
MLTGFGDSVRYLEFYHHCARPALSNSFDSDFWGRITLQMAHAEPAVRHALIALGYLLETEDGSMKHARSKFAGHHESRTLLHHYNKSVTSLVNRMTEATYSPEVALVTCVLFVCIDFLRGNYITAFQHLTNGLKIVSEHHKRVRSDSVMSQSQTSGSPLTTSLVRPTSMIEEELRPIFIRAMSSAMMYGVEVRTISYYTASPSLNPNTSSNTQVCRNCYGSAECLSSA